MMAGLLRHMAWELPIGCTTCVQTNNQNNTSDLNDNNQKRIYVQNTDDGDTETRKHILMI